MPRDDTAPCIGCGLCCDGTLFVRATVSPDEEERIGSFGLELINDEQRTYFRLPCRYHCEGRCSIYEERFDICRSFRCALLRRYQAGKIDLSEARAAVEEAFGLIAEATVGDSTLRLIARRRARRQELAERLPILPLDERTETARELLKLVALDTFLERWFKTKQEQDQAEPG